MKLNNLFKIFVLSLMLLSSCEDELLDVCPSHSEVIIDAEKYYNSPQESLVINKMSVVNDSLQIVMTASGETGATWIVNLYDQGTVYPTEPIYRNLKLSLHSDEKKLKEITKTYSFSITNLQVEGESIVHLKVSGKTGNSSYSEVFYQY